MYLCSHEYDINIEFHKVISMERHSSKITIVLMIIPWIAQKY